MANKSIEERAKEAFDGFDDDLFIFTQGYQACNEDVVKMIESFKGNNRLVNTIIDELMEQLKTLK